MIQYYIYRLKRWLNLKPIIYVLNQVFSFLILFLFAGFHTTDIIYYSMRGFVVLLSQPYDESCKRSKSFEVAIYG